MLYFVKLLSALIMLERGARRFCLLSCAIYTHAHAQASL